MWARDRGTASCVYTKTIDLGRVVDWERELYDLTLYRQDLTLGDLLDLVELAEEFTDLDLGPLGPVLGLIPSALRDLDIGYLRVSVEGRLLLTVQLDLLLLVHLGASQQGVIGAPGTADTLRPILGLDVSADGDLSLGWEYCVVAVYGGYDAFRIPIFGPIGIDVPGYEFEVYELDVPGLVCTLAMIVDLLLVDR